MYGFVPAETMGWQIFMWVWDGMGQFLHSNQRTHLTIVSIQPPGVLIICIYNNYLIMYNSFGWSISSTNFNINDNDPCIRYHPLFIIYCFITIIHYPCIRVP